MADVHAAGTGGVGLPVGCVVGVGVGVVVGDELVVGDGLGEPHIGGQAGEYYLVYFGRSAPKSWDVEFYKKNLADGMRFKADVIDPWVMTITPVDGEFSLKRKDDYTFADAAGRSIALPGKRYMALRFRRVP